MNNETVALSLRIPADAHRALLAFASQEGITVTDALLQAVFAFLLDKDSTEDSVKIRLDAEVRLSNEVLAYAQSIKETDYGTDATYHLFDMIERKHIGLYKSAIGQNGEQAYRINPQIAKRFALAIGAFQVLNEKGNPSKVYLERNANKLIQSYTKLGKR
jgi:hypothetical protein